MQEPSPRNSRLAIAGGLAAVILVGGAGFFVGRSSAPAPEPVPEPVETPAPAPPEPAPEVVRILNRADIVAMADQTADALTSGMPVPDSVLANANRRFVLALPFGCVGPAREDSIAPLQWRYDEEGQVLRLRATPTSWSPVVWGIGESAQIEAIEGFWLGRPWSSSATCPEPVHVAVTGTEPVTLPGQTLAVAQFFTGSDRRSALRGERPFESVQRVPLAEFDASRGFRLMLSGRIGSVPGGGPVQCIQPAGIEQRPICVVAIMLDEVRLENPIGPKVIATWQVDSE